VQTERELQLLTRVVGLLVPTEPIKRV
jgi:hypothetical protein